MHSYKLTNGTSILRSDGASIPNDEANSDYAEYLEFVEDGGVAESATPIALVSPNVAIFAQISALEASQNRSVREAAIGVVGAEDRLKALDARIVDLRKQLGK